MCIPQAGLGNVESAQLVSSCPSLRDGQGAKDCGAAARAAATRALAAFTRALELLPRSSVLRAHVARLRTVTAALETAGAAQVDGNCTERAQQAQRTELLWSAPLAHVRARLASSRRFLLPAPCTASACARDRVTWGVSVDLPQLSLLPALGGKKEFQALTRKLVRAALKL